MNCHARMCVLAYLYCCPHKFVMISRAVKSTDLSVVTAAAHTHSAVI